MALFAIKDCVDVTFTSLSDPGTTFTVDFANECSLQLEADQLYATRKGDNYISFSSGRTGTFSMTAECIDDKFLALLLGGNYEDSTGKIEVNGDIPSDAFKAEGTFKVKTDQGKIESKKIVFYKLAPQVGVDMTLSCSDIGSFTLTMDVLADETGKLFDIEKVSL